MHLQDEIFPGSVIVGALLAWGLMQRRNKPTQTHLDPALSLVECSVCVSPTLARLMRKCVTITEVQLAIATYQEKPTRSFRLTGSASVH
jgi:hypothetical protein